MKEIYEIKNFRPATMKIIKQANDIISEYQGQGFRLTLRQLYYQFVARALIANSLRSYQRLGSIIGDGRLAGLIDWDAIEDRTRSLRAISHWDNPSDIIYSSYMSFRLDKWERQPHRIEVWIEKEALSGVIAPVCNRLDVAYFANKGYMSLSEMHRTGKRMARYIKSGQEVHILHLGDHDPSGIDMTRDIGDRVSTFALNSIDVDRLALNFNQIYEYNPPPNFAKVTDSRYDGYAKLYGTDSWELDALEPAVLGNIIETKILELRDDDLWEEAVDEENNMRKSLRSASDNWGAVVRFLESENND
jgi:hypothetical protein